MAEFIIAKYRNGSLGTAKLKFIGKYTKFDNYESYLSPNSNYFHLFDLISRPYIKPRLVLFVKTTKTNII
jgi:hypothetical protein